MPEIPAYLNLSVTDTIFAFIGMETVSKDRMERYCRLAESSPARRAVAVLFLLPPLLLNSLSSSTHPSLVLAESNIFTRIGILVAVNVTVGVKVDVLVAVAV